MIGTTAHRDGNTSLLISLVAFYVILRSGVVIIMTLDEVFIYIDLVACAILTLHVLRNGILLDKRASVVLTLVVLWILLISIVHNDSAYKVYLALVMSFYLTFISAAIVSFEQFRVSFSRVVVFVAAISLGFFLFRDQLSIYYSHVEIITNNSIASYYNFWVWISHLEAIDRNFGVFWEPGAFQVFLNLALLFILQDPRQSRRLKVSACFILTAAILSTYSTTGYIGCVLVYGAALLRSTNRLTSRKTIVVVAGFIVLVTATFTVIISNDVISSKFTPGRANYGSFAERYNATLLDAELLSDNILWGVGVGNYMRERGNLEESTGLTAATTPNTYSIIGATFGLVALVFYLTYHIRLSWYLSNNILQFVPVLLLILLTFATENFLYLKLSHLLFWYGILISRSLTSYNGNAHRLRLSQTTDH